MTEGELKEAFLLRALGTGDTVDVHVNADLCALPAHLKGRVLLRLGYNLPLPTMIATSINGFTSRLSFWRAPFDCFIPWAAVLAVGCRTCSAAWDGVAAPDREFQIEIGEDEPTQVARRPHLRIVK